MAKNYYLSGQWNVTCDVCSKKVKSHLAKHRWDGFITCPDCWEQRQSLDFIRARTDKITVPFQRPIPTLEFIPQNFEQPLTDRVYTEERLTRIVDFIREFSDTTVTTDTSIEFQMDHGRSFTDTVTTSEIVDTLKYTQLDLSDTVSISEVTAKNASLPISDTTTISDAYSKVIEQVKTDSVLIADVVQKIATQQFTDSVSLADSIHLVEAANDAVNDTAINTQAIN